METDVTPTDQTVKRLVAYETVPDQGYGLAAAPHGRDWMDTTHERSAYRCLPMLMANQAGWLLLNPCAVRVRWDGGPHRNSIELQRWEPPPGAELPKPVPDFQWVMSHFGSGILTFTFPYLFRTPDGYDLLVRGPANSPKDGIAPLEGLVETDWTPATFTMNWKITRPHTWITFDEGEPVAMVVPQRRGELEEFSPEVLPIESNPELAAAHVAWGESRDRFNDARKEAGSEAARLGWERHYLRGTSPDGLKAQEHRTRQQLRPFAKTDQ